MSKKISCGKSLVLYLKGNDQPISLTTNLIFLLWQALILK